MFSVTTSATLKEGYPGPGEATGTPTLVDMLGPTEERFGARAEGMTVTPRALSL